MDHISVGKTGEDIACKVLIKRGHDILERNFRRKIGELDIVSLKEKIVYFSEVKTLEKRKGNNLVIRPEEHVTAQKLRKLSQIAQVYLEKFPKIIEWKFLVIAIVLDSENRTARVKVISDVLS